MRSVINRSTVARSAVAVAAVGAALACGLAPANADTYGTTNASLNGYIYFSGSAGTCKTAHSGGLGACTNKVTSITQRGYTGSYQFARLYWGSSYSGAYACMSPGTVWKETSSSTHITFNYGSGKSGYGERVWNNIASIKWAGSC